MTRHVFTNPKSFVREAYKAKVRHDILIDAIECIGKQQVCLCFEGKTKRAGYIGISSAQLDNWLLTFEFIEKNPNHIDNDPYQARSITPTEKWYEYLEFAFRKIEQIDIDSWKNKSMRELGETALKFGMTLGIRNYKALQNILERMTSMVERRRKIQANPFVEVKEETDYRMMNVPTLHKLCKTRNILSSKMSKDQMVEILSKEKVIQVEKKESAIKDLTLFELKSMAKDIGLTRYNNLKKEELVDLIEEKEESDNRLMMGDIVIISRSKDKYINATQLCKAGGVEFKAWFRIQKTKDFLNELSSSVNIPTDDLVQYTSNVRNEERATWVHPRVAINIAQWISPKFDVIVSGWIEKLLSTGSVSLKNPLKSFSNWSDTDQEAYNLEIKDFCRYTQTSLMYVSYIGDGMLKIGYTDDILNRNHKHTSSESDYDQWRIIGLFKVSSRLIENKLHTSLSKYKVVYNFQKEIFRPIEMSLKDFVNMIKDLLCGLDLPLRIQELERENMELRQMFLDAKERIMELV